MPLAGVASSSLPRACAWSISVLTASSFCFYGSSAHGVHHSFPTRRSSDLHLGSHFPDQSATLTVLPLKALPQAAARSVSRDRKSTRLNSSHANISYAVSCLKKKISEHSLEPTPQLRVRAREPRSRCIRRRS